MTLIWWLIANNVGGNEVLAAAPVKGWAGTLILAVALDLSAGHAQVTDRYPPFSLRP